MARRTYQLEFPLERVSLTQLWNMITTTQGLNSWLDAKVAIDNNLVTFHWIDSEPTQAQISVDPTTRTVTFRWIDEESGFKLQVLNSELTKELTLAIVDSCEEEDYEGDVQIWKRQVAQLYRALGLQRQ